jgi:hypothetical protein
VKRVIGEVFLDDVTAVPQANDEIIYAMCGIHLHDVPKDRPATDFHHGFGAERCFLAKAGAESTGKDYSFQSTLASNFVTLSYRSLHSLIESTDSKERLINAFGCADMVA